MPVRIYDISKKLGLENKEVLARAKALGIAARVASSSLDKITAEYLEQQILQERPDLAARSVPASAPPPASLPPPGPKVGDKVGFVQLPPKPGPKIGDKLSSFKAPPRPLEPRRTDFSKRGDIRSVRGGIAAPAGPAVPGAKFPPPQKGA